MLSRALTLASAALATAAPGAVPAFAGPTKVRGTFQTLPDGAAMGLDIEGFATLVPPGGSTAGGPKIACADLE